MSGFGRFDELGVRRKKSGPDRSFPIFLQENGKRPVWPRFFPSPNAYLPIAFNRSAFVCGVFVLWTER